MKILFINNDLAGFAGEKEIEEGTTVKKFLEDELKDFNDINYLIRVNRQVVTAETVLVEGSRITATPNKIGGNC